MQYERARKYKLITTTAISVYHDLMKAEGMEPPLRNVQAFIVPRIEKEIS
jgi:hypothetical protein